MNVRRLAVAFLALAALPSLDAQQPPAHAALTLSAAIDSALRNSPDVLIARAIEDSARAEGRIARAIPNPQFAVIPNTPFQYSVSIPFDVGPQRQGRARVARLGVAAAGADTREVTRQLTLAVARSYADVLFADARHAIVVARRGIMQQLVAADSVRVRTGDLPERALIRSQVELIRADADVDRAGIDAKTARLTLQSLMGVVHADSALLLADSLAYHPAPYLDEQVLATADHRPDVIAARTRVEQSAAAQRLASAFLIPVPQLSWVQQFGAPYATGSYTALGIGFEVPWINGYHGQADRAAAAQEAARLNSRRVEAAAERELNIALTIYHAQLVLVRRYESGVIARVTENVEATRYAYRRGAASLLEVLDALRAQQDVLTDYLTALHDYSISVYTLQAANGVPVH